MSLPREFTPLPQESFGDYTAPFSCAYWEPLGDRGMPKSALFPATEMDRMDALGVYNGADVVLAKIDEIEPGGEFDPAAYPNFSIAVSEYEAYIGSGLGQDQLDADNVTELSIADRPLGYYIQADGQDTHGVYTYNKVGHLTMRTILGPMAQRGVLHTNIYPGATISRDEFDPSIKLARSLVHIDRHAVLDMGMPKLKGWQVGPTYHKTRSGTERLLRVRHTDVYAPTESTRTRKTLREHLEDATRVQAPTTTLVPIPVRTRR